MAGHRLPYSPSLSFARCSTPTLHLFYSRTIHSPLFSLHSRKVGFYCAPNMSHRDLTKDVLFVAPRSNRFVRDFSKRELRVRERCRAIYSGVCRSVFISSGYHTPGSTFFG